MPVTPFRIELRQRQVGRGAPRGVPSSLVENGVGFLVATQMTKRESQVVERLPLPWVGVTKGQCLDGLAEKLLSFCKFSPAQMPGTHRIVAAAVSGVAAERLAPIHVSMTRGMTILIEVQTCDIEFVVAPDFFWMPRLGRGSGHLLFFGRGRP